jgi:hypothetical protein
MSDSYARELLVEIHRRLREQGLIGSECEIPSTLEIFLADSKFRPKDKDLQYSAMIAEKVANLWIEGCNLKQIAFITGLPSTYVVKKYLSELGLPLKGKKRHYGTSTTDE